MLIDISGVEANVAYLFLLGCVAGLLSGFFGIGGGALITPILQIIFQIPFHICVGSSLAQTVGSSFTAVLRHWQMGNVDLKLALMILGGNFLGVEAGARILDYLNDLGTMVIRNQETTYVEYYSRWLFLCVLLLVAILIMAESFRNQGNLQTEEDRRNLSNSTYNGFLQRFHIPPLAEFPTSCVSSISIFAVSYPAFLIGVTTGLLGIGGGVITIPLLIYGYGATTRKAVGTGLLLVFSSTLYGTVTHAIRHNVDLQLVAILLIGSTICAQFGAIATQAISGRSIRFYFSFIVLGVAGLLLYDLSSRFL